jgi:hypothetical protein
MSTMPGSTSGPRASSRCFAPKSLPMPEMADVSAAKVIRDSGFYVIY